MGWERLRAASMRTPSAERRSRVKGDAMVTFMQEKQGQSRVEQGPDLTGVSSQSDSQQELTSSGCIKAAAVEVTPLRARRVTTSTNAASIRKEELITVDYLCFTPSSPRPSP